MPRHFPDGGAGRHRKPRRSQAGVVVPLPVRGEAVRRDVLHLSAPPSVDPLSRLDRPQHFGTADLRDPVADAPRRSAAVIAGAVTVPTLIGITPAAAAVEPKADPTPTVTLPAGVEQFSPYLAPVSCDPVTKPGVVAFSDVVLSQWGRSGTYGSSTPCDVLAPTEEQEGRAFDLPLDPDGYADQVTGQQIVDWLLAGDATNARRLGVMTMVWNGQIWSADQHEDGWRPYDGPADHASNLHVVFSWAGAMKRTSWWTGVVAPVEYGPCQKYTGTPPAAYGTTINLSPCPKPKPTYRVVRVKSGQTLARIAQRHDTSVRRIVRLNHLKDKHVSAGQQLRVAIVDVTGADISRSLYSPVPNPRTSADALVWARSMVGDYGWRNLCLNFTARAYGWNHAGTRYAINHWQSTPTSLRHPGQRNAPAGALMYWDTGLRAGHVALSLGNGYVVSNDIVTPGRISIVRASTIDEKWNARYLGWTAPYFPDGA